MKMLDRMLNATRLAGRTELSANRTAADDLRAMGFPSDPGAGSGRTAVEDPEEEASADPDLTEDLEEELDPQKQVARGETADPDELESFGHTDATDPDYKKRFIGSQKQHLDDVRAREAMQTRLDRLEVQARTTPHVETTPQRDETASRLQSELDQIPADDKDARRKTIEKWTGTIRHVAKEEGKAAAQEVVTEHEAQRQGYQTAVARMKDALAKKGLDPEKYFTLADQKAAHLKNTNKQWFSEVPGDQQFDAIADLVLADRNMILGEKTREANEALRKDAAGVVGKGNKTPKPKSSDKEDVPDRSFTQQLKDNRRVLQKNGADRYTNR